MIHVFRHTAMATQFQVRLATDDAEYAAQAAQTAFLETDRLENYLSRFRPNSDIAALAQLQPGETLRVTEPAFACLTLAREMETATGGAFSPTATARRTQGEPPRWTLVPENFSIRCDSGRLEFDLGAIGKGFALDRMAEVLCEWSCPDFLLVAGFSSILAGGPPPGKPGWSVGLGEASPEPRYALTHASMSGSGIAVQGRHILDPRTGTPAVERAATWALAPSAAVTDALSTACMVLREPEIETLLAGRNDWLVWLPAGAGWRSYGGRPLPERAE